MSRFPTTFLLGGFFAGVAGTTFALTRSKFYVDEKQVVLDKVDWYPINYFIRPRIDFTEKCNDSAQDGDVVVVHKMD